jgi:hypothetical protein
MFRRLLLGAAAGAAGTTALHAATYLDMALRGRPTSSTPERTVEKLAANRHVDIPGAGAERENRLTGLGALSGIATGVGFGVAYGALDVLRVRPHGLGALLLAGAGPMVFSNTTMARLGITDPRSWSKEDWLSDLLPHLAYGAALSAAYSLATQPVETRLVRW